MDFGCYHKRLKVKVQPYMGWTFLFTLKVMTGVRSSVLVLWLLLWIHQQDSLPLLVQHVWLYNSAPVGFVLRLRPRLPRLLYTIIHAEMN